MNFGWIGAVTDGGFTAAVEVTGPVDIRLAVSTSSDMSSPVFSSSITDADGWNKLSITGLSADTVYFWSLEEDTVVGAAEGSIRTFPTEGSAASFTVAAASCCQSNTNPNTFTRIENRSPTLFMHMGDMFYEDINTNNAALYEAAFEMTLGQSNQASLYKNIPTFYMWDDHDYGPNNSDGSTVSRPAALTAFRTCVPHPPISFSGPDNDTPVSNTFVCGRIRFVQLDTRSDADHTGTAGNGELIGSTQLAWLIDIIETFTEALLVIDVSVPWIVTGGDVEVGDDWGHAQAERTAISNAIQDHAEGKVILIHGDAHMVAMDDGTNSNFATSPSGPGPRVCCFGPLNRSNSVKGGPYSEGTFSSNTTQYGTLAFDDSGSAITVTATGYRASDDTQLVSMSWEVGGLAVSDQIIYWAEDVTEADAFDAGTVCYVKTDGSNPTRVRMNGAWLNITSVLQGGLEYEIDEIVEAGGAGGGANPGDLSPDIWYDISDLSTLFKDDAGTDPVTTDGDRVALVLDKSGNGVHLRQTNATNRPEYHTDGTHHWLLYDGIDYFMQTDDFTFTQPTSRGYVYEVENIPGSTRPMIDGDDTTNRAYLGLDNTGRLTMWANSFRTGHFVNINSPDYAIAVYNGSDSSLEHAKGGAKGNVGTRNSRGLYFGRHVSGSPMTEHHMFEFVEFNRALNDTEKTQLREYYETTYSIDSAPKDLELTRLDSKSTSTVLYGSLAANGKIYAPSFSGSNATMLTVDTATDTVGSIASVGTTFAGSGYGNGKVYCLPYNEGASQEIAVIDTSDDSVTTIAIPNKTVDHIYYGQAVRIGDILYCSPYGGGRILRIDTSTDTVDFFGDTLACTGVNCYGSGVLVGDLIYFVPRNPTFIQVLDTTTGTVTGIDTTGFGNGNVKWVGGVLAPNGKIYCTPRDSDEILVIDTENSNALSSIATGLTGSDKFNGQEKLGNGLIAMFPRSASQVMLIDSATDTMRFAKIIYDGNTNGDIGITSAQKWVGSTPLDADTVYLMPFDASYPAKFTSLIPTQDTDVSSSVTARATVTASMLTPPVVVTAKPAKPFWFHAGHWWVLGQHENGWYIFRLTGESWQIASDLIQDIVFFTSADVALDADAGEIVYYGWDETASQMGRWVYNSGTNRWEVVGSQFSVPQVGTRPGHMVVDSVGRSWGFGDGVGETHYFVRDTDLTILQGETLLVDGLPTGTNHLSRSVAWEGKIGVLFDNQTTGRMRFIWRNDSDPITTWQTIENASSDDLPGNADDHADIVPGPDGDLLAVWKTELGGADDPNIMYARRTSEGEWVEETAVWNRFGAANDSEHTRPRIVFDRTNDHIYVFASRTFLPGPVEYKSVVYRRTDFSAEETLLATDFFDITTPAHSVNTASGLRILTRDDNNEAVTGFIEIGVSPIVYWAQNVTEADSFQQDTAVYVKTDGPNPTRVRLNGKWHNILKYLKDGVEHTLIEIQEIQTAVTSSVTAKARVRLFEHAVANPVLEATAVAVATSDATKLAQMTASVTAIAQSESDIVTSIPVTASVVGVALVEASAPIIASVSSSVTAVSVASAAMGNAVTVQAAVTASASSDIAPTGKYFPESSASARAVSEGFITSSIPLEGSTTAVAKAEGDGGLLQIIARPSSSVTAKANAFGSLGLSGTFTGRAFAQAAASVTHHTLAAQANAFALSEAFADIHVPVSSSVTATAAVESDAVKLFHVASSVDGTASVDVDLDKIVRPNSSLVARAIVSGNWLKKRPFSGSITAVSVSSGQAFNASEASGSIVGVATASANVDAFKVLTASAAAVASSQLQVTVTPTIFFTSDVVARASTDIVINKLVFPDMEAVAVASISGRLRGFLAGDAAQHRRGVVAFENRTALVPFTSRVMN